MIEARLDLLGLAYEREVVDDLFKSAAACESLARVYPIAQVPTLVLTNGTAMTEKPRSRFISPISAKETDARMVVDRDLPASAFREASANADQSRTVATPPRR